MSYISDDLDDEIKKYSVNQMLKYYDDEPNDDDLLLGLMTDSESGFDEYWTDMFTGGYERDSFVRQSPDTVYDKFDDLPEDKDRNKAKEFILSGRGAKMRQLIRDDLKDGSFDTAYNKRQITRLDNETDPTKIVDEYALLRSRDLKDEIIKDFKKSRINNRKRSDRNNNKMFDSGNDYQGFRR